jgi:hydrogenase maturation protease
LIVIDGCRGAQIGTITRLQWPDPRIRQHHNHSTHGVGLCNALQLAEQLGRIPPDVEILGIEIGAYKPIGEMSPDILMAVVELEAVIFDELREVVRA